MLKNLKQFNLPEIEEKVLEFWRTNQIFKKSLALRQAQGKKAKKFIFFEGPPTANGRPGIHHVLARVFKDIILRYKTMAGFFVPRRAGWDTHGLPVEIEIEKELGIRNKQEIEKFGITEFNQRAKASVWKYKTEWEKLTERIGFWLDLDNPYITYDNKYIESLWWIFSQIAKRNLLKKFYKIVPYCPRCQTPLSSHEMGQPDVYQKVKDSSIYIKFKVESRKSKAKNNEYLLVWTTTPWTLTANLAIAVHPGLTYTKYKISEKNRCPEYLWSFNPPPALPNVEISVVEKMAGKHLVGLKYEPLYKIQDSRFKIQDVYCVVAADFVSTEEGTGLVHIAPTYGEDDFNLMTELKFPMSEMPVTIDNRGVVIKGFPGAGKFVKEADKDIVEDLKNRGLLYHQSIIEHDYPFCWRCSTPLVYFARFSWFIEMTKLRNNLIRSNKKINWMPGHLKEGRFGEWLNEVKDWAISRERYWATPLPIWEHPGTEAELGAERDAKVTKCKEMLVIGGLEDLNKYAYFKNKFFFFRHGEAMHNVKDVIASGPEKGSDISRLTEKGIKQTNNAAEKLKNEEIDIIYSSPYFRTKQTAEIVSKATGAKIIFDKRLEEINTGVFNWRPAKEHKTFFANPLEEFTKTPAGGENLTDVKIRMFSFLRDINGIHQNKNILIVGHGDPLWVLEGAMRGLSNEEILKLGYPELGNYKKVALNNWSYDKESNLDLHRPYIDEIHLKCPKCGGKMTRIKEVADVWFDSGSMPFAQWHYPFENKDFIDKKLDFPADYITEGIDQTRGWFYTLLAVSTLLKKEAPYRNVISLGLINDKYGQKMSKSKGNVVEPLEIAKKYGIDPLRWYFYTVNPPGETKNFDENELGKILRRFILILYNSFNFYEQYADKTLTDTDKTRTDTGSPHKSMLSPYKSENVLDRWIVTRLNQLILESTENLDKYEISETGRLIEVFIDDLSRWYIRRSRSRFQEAIRMGAFALPEPKAKARYSHAKDWHSASLTLHHVLLEISKLIAPFMPFFAESLFKSLVISHESSVHLANWPSADKKLIDKKLLEAMAEVRRLASLALAQREEAKIKVRQPLQKLKVKSEKLKAYKELLDLLKDEINVKEIIFDQKITKDIELDTTITPKLRDEGIIRELTRMIQGLRHDANYKISDKITLMAELPREFLAVVERNIGALQKAVNAKNVEFKKSAKVDAGLEGELENQKIWIGISKV